MGKYNNGNFGFLFNFIGFTLFAAYEFFGNENSQKIKISKFFEFLINFPDTITRRDISDFFVLEISLVDISDFLDAF